jgi:tetratricopeptide (TPR) repeat protein
MGEPNHNFPFRKLLCLSVLLPAALLLAVEGAFRIFWSAEGGAYQVFVRKGGGLVVRPEYQGAFHALRIAEKKPEGTFRILCLGGSSTYGFPFGEETAFSHWLQKLLDEYQPKKKWEVLNLGAMSYGSKRILELMPEFILLQPDVILLYTGHNEFVERTHATARRDQSRLRMVQFLRTRLGKKEKQKSSAEVYRETIHLRSEPERDAAIARFRKNYRQIIAVSKAANVPILVSTMPSSLKDWKPDGSKLFRLKDHKSWKEKFARACTFMNAGEVEKALTIFLELERLDPSYAGLHFKKGQCLLQLGRFEEAGEAFILARDNDASPQRALSGINAAILEVAAGANAPCVKAVQVFNAHSDNGITGKKLIEDYVHPTLAGHRILAAEFYVALHTELKWEGRLNRDHILVWLSKLPEPEPSGPGRASFFYNLGLRFINQENWLKVIETNRQAIHLDPSHALAYNNLGRGYQQKGEMKEALESFQKAAALRPDIAGIHRNLASLFQGIGRLDEAESAAEKAVNLNSDDPNAHYLLATILSATEQTEGAIEHYNEAARLRPDYFEAHANLGLAYALIGQNEKARSAWKKALEIKPGEPVVSDWLVKLK